MELDQVVNNSETKLNQAVDRFSDGLKSLRTGRASASMLDSVKVEAYGTQMPLIQVGSITVPEAQLIQISPFDPNNLEAISNAIREDSSLGLNPSDDGRVIRINIPPLTEERRRELAKQIGQKQEECNIALRNIRHETMDAIDKAKKDKQVGEDEAKRLSDKVEGLMSKAKAKADEVAQSKEAEILTL